MTGYRASGVRGRWGRFGLAACLQASCALCSFAQDSPRQPVPEQSFFPVPVTVPRETGAATRARLRVDVQKDGSSSRAELAAARQRLPLNPLTPAQRQLVNGVVQSPSLYRRLPTIACQADARTYSFFTTHPDVAVSIWRVMGISDMQMRQTGPDEFEIDLRDGTFGVVKVLHRAPDRLLILCEGQFKSPLLTKTIRSTGLMSLQMQTWHDAAGTSYVSHSGDVFVQFHSDAVEAIAKLISPMSFKMVDRNFEEVTLFLRMMDEAMSREPGWIEYVAGELDGVLPGRDKELLKVTAEVFVDQQRRRQRQQGDATDSDIALPPVRSAGGVTPAPSR